MIVEKNMTVVAKIPRYRLTILPNKIRKQKMKKGAHKIPNDNSVVLSKGSGDMFSNVVNLPF